MAESKDAFTHPPRLTGQRYAVPKTDLDATGAKQGNVILQVKVNDVCSITTVKADERECLSGWEAVSRGKDVSGFLDEGS